MAYYEVLVLHIVKDRTMTYAFSICFDAMLLPTRSLYCCICQEEITIAKFNATFYTIGVIYMISIIEDSTVIMGFRLFFQD